MDLAIFVAFMCSPVIAVLAGGAVLAAREIDLGVLPRSVYTVYYAVYVQSITI